MNFEVAVVARAQRGSRAGEDCDNGCCGEGEDDGAQGMRAAVEARCESKEVRQCCESGSGEQGYN